MINPIIIPFVLLALVGWCYTSACLTFVLIRYSHSEGDDRMQQFLSKQHRFLASGVTPERGNGLSRQLHLSVFRRHATFMLPALVLFLLYPSWLMSIMLLVAAQVVAIEIACSWYASRCMRKLGIVAYPVKQ
jgi:hypothetical protein